MVAFSNCESISKPNNSIDVTFASKDENIQLSGTLTMPISDSAVPVVILIHGSGGHTRNQEVLGHSTFKELADYLSKNGIAVLRFDKRGCGKSGGTFIPFDLDAFIADALGAVSYLKQFKGIDPDRIGVIGHSQGGLLAPKMAVADPDIAFMVLLAAPGNWDYDFFYESHKAMALAGGFPVSEVPKMEKQFIRFWGLMTKAYLSDTEREDGVELLKVLWACLDMPSRVDFGFIDDNADLFFNHIYRTNIMLDLYGSDLLSTLREIACPVLALNGDKDVQVISSLNLPLIASALRNGKCENYTIKELADHNHIFQRCKTGKISEYKHIKRSFSYTSLKIIKDWILDVNQDI